MPEQPQQTNDQPLGVPPSEFHPQKPETPFKKRGKVKTAIIVGILIIILDLFIYFFLIKPDDAQLLKAIEPLKPPTATVAPSTVQQETPSEAAGSATVSKVSNLAKEDLAKRLNIAVTEVEVISEEPTTWNDGSMGCPNPDMMYTQATTEGTKIVLVAKQKSYDYHAGTNDEPFLCEQPAL
jgi:hypothetical protein